MANAHIAALYRYPVKGLSAEALKDVTMEAGATLPFDRVYAIENGRRAFDPSSPRHLPKTTFLCQMRDERLAELQTSFDAVTGVLTISRASKAQVKGCLPTAEGRSAIEAFFAKFMSAELHGVPRVVCADGHSFSDVKDKCVHLINLASVRALAALLGVAIDPMRFRANVLIDGLEAWAELDWVGRDITLGAAKLAVFKRTVRCEATNVNPSTAQRDMALPDSLAQHFGHRHFGIYARVTHGGIVSVGDAVNG